VTDSSNKPERRRVKSNLEQEHSKPHKPKPKSTVSSIFKDLQRENSEVASESALERVEHLSALAEEHKQKVQARAQQRHEKSRAKEAKMHDMQEARDNHVSPDVQEFERRWFSKEAEQFPELVCRKAFTWSERSNIHSLMEVYDKKQLLSAVDYLFDNWKHISVKFFKGKAVAPKLPMLLKLHDGLVTEAVIWERYSNVAKEMKAWDDSSGPAVMSPPDDLAQRYTAARNLAIKAGLIEG